MLTLSCIVVKCFPGVKRASVYLVAYIDTGLGDLSIYFKPEDIALPGLLDGLFIKGVMGK